MEHLDSLAGSIAYKHMLGPGTHTLGRIDERGFYIVTASVDRLDMLAPLSSTRDLRLSGQVIYTGRSSMEVAVKMEAFGDNKPEETVLLGRFSMVCRDAHTHRARKVNPLLCTTPEQKALHDLGELVNQRRTALAQISLSRVPPSSAEAAELHAIHLKHGQGIMQPLKVDSGKDHVWMGDTILEENRVMFPQERNVDQKVFGGYLMRLASKVSASHYHPNIHIIFIIRHLHPQLGYTSASMSTRANVKFLSHNDCSPNSGRGIVSFSNRSECLWRYRSCGQLVGDHDITCGTCHSYSELTRAPVFSVCELLWLICP
ncbi:HotDog domain-containing protein [Panaeolus papilionaceus]|nr:HotDog domain-containing protein [Panaeolus papilionaceus]